MCELGEQSSDDTHHGAHEEARREDAEKVEEEDPSLGMALIRTIFAALLYEMSFVTRPAYPDTQVEARNWSPTDGGVLLPENPPVRQVLNRWRA